MLRLKCVMGRNDLTIEECRKLFKCDEDGIECRNCPCLKVLVGSSRKSGKFISKKRLVTKESPHSKGMTQNK